MAFEIRTNTTPTIAPKAKLRQLSHDVEFA
jgi:hypothetical protein